jgi:hypothetical protein
MADFDRTAKAPMAMPASIDDANFTIALPCSSIADKRQHSSTEAGGATGRHRAGLDDGSGSFASETIGDPAAFVRTAPKADISESGHLIARRAGSTFQLPFAALH